MAFGKNCLIFAKTSKNLSKESFDVQNYIAQGATGKIFLVKKNRGTNQNKLFAMKVMHKQKLLSQHGLEAAENEVKAMKIMEHPFIIELKYAFQNKYNLFIVMEYAPRGTLTDFLMQEMALPEKIARYYMRELVLAVEYMHSRNLLHGDIKPHNVLIDARGHAKLADFGLVKHNISAESVVRDYCGTAAFMAPEYRSEEGYCREVDWWALGITLYCMVFGDVPVKQGLNKILKGEVLGGIYAVSINARSLIVELRRRKPSEIGGDSGAQQVKNHIFFKGTCWDNVLKNAQHDSPYLSLLPTIKKKSISLLDKFTRFMGRKNDVEKWFPKCTSCPLKCKEFSYHYEELQEEEEEMHEFEEVNTSKTKLLG